MEDNYIVLRRLKQQKLRREARRGQIKLRRLYKFIRFLFVLFVFYSAYRLLLVHYWYVNPNIFQIKDNNHIEILGNKIVSNEKIYETLSDYIVEKKPIYKINPNEISRRIKRLSPIKNVYVRRFWLPARFVIMTEEVTPVLTIAPSEEAPLICAFAITGELIPREYLPFDEKLKTVKILTYGTKGDDYNDWSKEKVLQLYKLAMTLESYTDENVEYIDLRNPHNVFVKITDTKIRLGELDSSLYKRINSVGSILKEVKPMLSKVKYIDLSWKDSKYLKME